MAQLGQVNVALNLLVHPINRPLVDAKRAAGNTPGMISIASQQSQDLQPTILIFQCGTSCMEIVSNSSWRNLGGINSE